MNTEVNNDTIKKYIDALTQQMVVFPEADVDGDLYVKLSASNVAEGSGVVDDHIWRRHNAWVVVGSAGTGKTELLKHLALQQVVASRETVDYLPVFINARAAYGYMGISLDVRHLGAAMSERNLRDENPVLDYIYEEHLPNIGFVDQTERDVLFSDIKNRLVEGRLMLIFDGLSELCGDAQLDVASDIRAIVRDYPKNRYLVGSRIDGYNDSLLGDGFQAMSLDPFSRDQVVEFFQRWMIIAERAEDIDPDEKTTARAMKKAGDFLELVLGNTATAAMATNPMMCAYMFVCRSDVSLPTSRTALYKRFCDGNIFDLESAKRRKFNQFNSLDKDQTVGVLEEIALHIHENSHNNTVSSTELLGVIGEYLIRDLAMNPTEDLAMNPTEAARKADQFLCLVRDVPGLIVCLHGETYGFAHLTIQEYYAARAITRRRKDAGRYLDRYIQVAAWREVFRFAVGHQYMKDTELGDEFVAAIREQCRCRDMDYFI